MIKQNLKVLFDQKGLNAYRISKQTGIHQATAMRLYRDPTYIPRPEVMEKLALVYGWQPGWYITYVPNEVAEAIGA